MKTITIPNDYNPFIVEVNGVMFKYPAGTEQSVPDHVAAVIEQYKNSQPKEAEAPVAGYVYTADGKWSAEFLPSQGGGGSLYLHKVHAVKSYDPEQGEDTGYNFYIYFYSSSDVPATTFDAIKEASHGVIANAIGERDGDYGFTIYGCAGFKRDYAFGAWRDVLAFFGYDSTPDMWGQMPIHKEMLEEMTLTDEVTAL